MNETTINDESIDDEKPSSIKEGFIRWLIVGGLLMTLLFIYLFWTMSSEQAAEDEEKKVVEKVPEQVQEGTNQNANDAVRRFKKNINSNRSLGDKGKAKVGDKLKTEAINETFAPRRTVAPDGKSNPTLMEKARGKRLLDANSDGESVYQKYLKEEQLRAYKSISSKDSIGKAKGYYSSSKNNTKKRYSKKKKRGETLKEKQSRLNSQLQQLEAYRKGIESGKIDPSKTPPPIDSNFKPFAPRNLKTQG